MAKFRAGVRAAVWQLVARAPTCAWALMGSRQPHLPQRGPRNHTAPFPLCHSLEEVTTAGTHTRPWVSGPMFGEAVC